MTRIVFGGTSAASLGEMLAGYGIIAICGELWPDAVLWWDDAMHVVADVPTESDGAAITAEIAARLKTWAMHTGGALQKRRKNKSKKISAGPSPLEDTSEVDALDARLAEEAYAAVVALGSRRAPHPLLPAFGQDGSANYFASLTDAAKRAHDEDIGLAFHGQVRRLHRRLDGGGGLFFPDAIKRYATGLKWEHEADAARTPWTYMLALRGVMVLRGAARSPRGSRRVYPAFPFVFGGRSVRAQGKVVEIQEIFLPAWSEARPRTFPELTLQVRQFQARVGRRDFAASSADLRRAIKGRAVSGGFDAFYRFALEPRKPGQKQPQAQAVCRGATRVGAGSAASLRVLLARLDDAGWLDRFTYDSRNKRPEALALERAKFDTVVHAALDDPTAERHVAVLGAIWRLQLGLHREVPDRFFPAPLLRAGDWERVLQPLLESSREARIAWAIASVGWIRVSDDARVRPVVEQFLPVEYDSKIRALRVPDPPPAARIAWRRQNPRHDFAGLFWRRWLDTADAASLPLGGTRCAALEDVLCLLSAELDVARVHELLAGFLVLDETGTARTRRRTPPINARPIPPAYAALRLWLELGIRPADGTRRPMDGDVARGIVSGTPGGVERAVARAGGRLRVDGLPGRWPDESRPRGGSVALPQPRITNEEARLLPLGLLVPVDSEAIDLLARRLYIAMHDAAAHEDRR